MRNIGYGGGLQSGAHVFGSVTRHLAASKTMQPTSSFQGGWSLRPPFFAPRTPMRSIGDETPARSARGGKRAGWSSRTRTFCDSCISCPPRNLGNARLRCRLSPTIRAFSNFQTSPPQRTSPPPRHG